MKTRPEAVPDNNALSDQLSMLFKAMQFSHKSVLVSMSTLLYESTEIKLGKHALWSPTRLTQSRQRICMVKWSGRWAGRTKALQEACVRREIFWCRQMLFHQTHQSCCWHCWWVPLPPFCLQDVPFDRITDHIAIDAFQFSRYCWNAEIISLVLSIWKPCRACTWTRKQEIDKPDRAMLSRFHSPRMNGDSGDCLPLFKFTWWLAPIFTAAGLPSFYEILTISLLLWCIWIRQFH